jgi:hypothetical protein
MLASSSTVTIDEIEYSKPTRMINSSLGSLALSSIRTICLVSIDLLLSRAERENVSAETVIIVVVVLDSLMWVVNFVVVPTIDSDFMKPFQSIDDVVFCVSINDW